MEGKLSVLLHLVGCRSPASRCSVTRSFSTFVISRLCTRGPRPRSPLFAGGSGCPVRPALSPFPPRRPQAPPRRTSFPHGDTSRFQWAPGSRPHSSELRLLVLTLRGGGRARGAPRPQAKNEEQKGPGPRPPPATPIANRAPPPAPRAARNGGCATKWQPAGRRSGDANSRPQPSARGPLSRVWGMPV